MLTSQLVKACKSCFINPSITGYHSCQQCINFITALRVCENCSKNRVIYGNNICDECKNKFYSTTKIYVEKKGRAVHPQDCDHPSECLQFKTLPYGDREYGKCSKCTKFFWNDSKDYDPTAFELDSCYTCGYYNCKFSGLKTLERKWDARGNLIPRDGRFKERDLNK